MVPVVLMILPHSIPLQALILSVLLRRYPDFLRMGMWFGLLLYFASLFASSFATKVRSLHLH